MCPPSQQRLLIRIVKLSHSGYARRIKSLNINPHSSVPCSQNQMVIYQSSQQRLLMLLSNARKLLSYLRFERDCYKFVPPPLIPTSSCNNYLPPLLTSFLCSDVGNSSKYIHLLYSSQQRFLMQYQVACDREEHHQNDPQYCEEAELV
jgi:hypothetical protein